MAKKKKRKKQQQPTNNNFSQQYITAAKDAKAAIAAFDRKIMKSVPKGTQYDWLNNANFNNVVYPRDKIPDRMLRLIERRNGIVGAGITLRIQQAIEFSQVSHNKDAPGWEFVLKKQDGTLSPEQEKQKEFLEDFMSKTHRTDYVPSVPHSDTFRDLITKFVRDRLLIDKVCWEIERDRKGETVALWVLDGSTILPVLPGGFFGSTSSIGMGISGGFSKLSDALRTAKIENIPPPEDIAYVQELFYGSSGGGITAGFRETDIIYDISNELNDIRYYKQGFSVVEKANLSVVAFINSLTYNSNGLSKGAIPKIAIAMGKDAGYTQEMLEDAQDEWAANYSAMDGQWNIPLLNSDAKVLQLMASNRDMEYQKFMEFVAALTLAEMGIDAAEIGLRLNQAQSVLSENQDSKQIFSKSRGVRDILGGFAYTVNRWLEISGFPFANDFIFKFNGLNVEDRGFEADLRTKDVKSIRTIDEVREELDLEPLPDGNGQIILDPVYMQYVQAKQQQQAMESDQGMGGGDEDFTEDDINSAVDESMSEFEKAITLM